jgi:ketosteroid isomerase-like protein
MDPQEIAKVFVTRINKQDVDGLCALMTEDHLFIDSGGGGT